ncbi:MAG: hypothetical protein C0483_06745 [Pirellula sp.]|nr:hypothetical protein [Pirellula sp.]
MRRATMLTPLVATTVVGFVVAACGCSSLSAPSAMEKEVLAPPSAAFMKRVKNDPFPSASEQTYVPPKAK